MPKLILVKHSAVRVEPGIPPEQWRLSEDGRRRCDALADRLAALSPAEIITSTEPKAAETGKIVADRLGVPLETAPGLHEHVRTRVPHMPTAQFISMVELMFRRPDELVLGDETAQQASDRFSRAVEGVLQSRAGQTVAIVTHGTVLALLVARHNPDQQAFGLWRSMQLPSFVVLTLPGMKVEQVVARVEL
jgi:broad specificity phosphatase PhoE